MRLQAYLFLTCLVPGVAVAATATARFERITVEDGLSQGSVNCIVQDEPGFLWFGTQDGLNRFDGYEFTVYRRDPDRPDSLAHNFVWDLLVGDDGSFWVATDGGGLDRMDPLSGGFAHYRNDPADEGSLPHDRVRALERGDAGRVWVGTDAGLASLDPKTGKFRRLAVTEGPDGVGAPARVRALWRDRGGRLWVGTEGDGLLVVGPDGDVKARFRHDPKDPSSLSNDRVRSVLEGPGGSIWVGTYEGGLNRLDASTNRWRRYSQADASGLAHDRVRALLHGSDGSIWIGTDGGLNRIRADSPNLMHYRYDAADPHSLANDRVLALFQDRGGVIWVATQGGLSRWNPSATLFEHIRQSASDPAGLASNVVNAVAEGPDGELWIGTFGGLSALDRATGQYRQYRHDPSDRSSLSDDRVMALRWTREGVLWVGTFAGGLNRFDPASGRFAHLRSDPEDPTTLGSEGVTSILEDREGRLWVGCYGGGLNLLDTSRREVRRYRADPDDPDGLADDRVMALAEDRSGALWIGTDGGGLQRFDPVSESFERFAPEPGVRSVEIVWSIHEGRDGALWIGTQGSGLLRWEAGDREAGTFRVRAYTERDGLPNAFVYGILEDDDGKLWLSTNRGLSCFDPEAGTFRTFGPSAGLQGLEFNFGAYYRSVSGEMFFGGSNGLNAFHPSRVVPNPYVPPVWLTRIVGVEGPLQLPAPPWRLDSLELGHRERVVAFEFAALDYTAPARNRYAYRLDGFDRDWVDLGTTRRATYTNLPPGHYVLRVRAARSDGPWNESGIALPLTVLPPPWATGWARAAYGLLIAAALLAALRALRLREKRRELYRKQLEEQVRERTTELAAANAQLREASLTDPLTGLQNRRYVLTTIRDEMAGLVRDRVSAQREGREDPHPHRVLYVMIDLDGFKQVNDAYGHETGDRVLLEVRDRIRAVCRGSDTVVRWGGDEFLLICRNTQPDGAEFLVNKIRARVAEEPIALDNGAEARIGCSIGFAFFPFDLDRPEHTTWEAVQIMADAAMYEAKRSGKNRWVGVFHRSDRPDSVPVDPRRDLPERLPAADGIRVVHGTGWVEEPARGR